MPEASAALPLPWLTGLSVLLGLALIGMAMLDVFLTVLHIQAESPISNAINRRFWTALLWITRPLPRATRDHILGWGAPLMIAGVLVFWTVLYIVGFSLLYAPFIHDPALFVISDTEPGNPLGDALYLSAASFLTTGYGDITPQHNLARLLTMLQGGLGLTTLSLSVTYLLSVYPLISRKVSMAEALNQETGGRPDGVVLAERYLKTGHHEALAERLAAINSELLQLGQAHGLYPVLYYVRHGEVHRSFVRLLALVQGIIATLRYTLDPDTYPEIVSDPRLELLEEGLLATLHLLAASSHLAPQRLTHDALAAAYQDQRDMIDQLRRRDLATVSPHDRQAVRRHASFRIATDQYIRAYAANSGYSMADVCAVYSRWERDTALVGHAELDEDDGEAWPLPTTQEADQADGGASVGSPQSNTSRSGSDPVLRNP